MAPRGSPCSRPASGTPRSPPRRSDRPAAGAPRRRRGAPLGGRPAAARGTPTPAAPPGARTRRCAPSPTRSASTTPSPRPVRAPVRCDTGIPTPPTLRATRGLARAARDVAPRVHELSERRHREACCRTRWRRPRGPRAPGASCRPRATTGVVPAPGNGVRPVSSGSEAAELDRVGGVSTTGVAGTASTGTDRARPPRRAEAGARTRRCGRAPAGGAGGRRRADRGRAARPGPTADVPQRPVGDQRGRAEPGLEGVPGRRTLSAPVGSGLGCGSQWSGTSTVDGPGEPEHTDDQGT